MRSALEIPVWHDDQQGSATVLLAGLIGALKVVGKTIGNIRTAMVGMGAANVAIYRLLKEAGIEPQGVVACDTGGTLHRGRADIEAQQELFIGQWRVCTETNAERVVGSIPDALRGADVCMAFSQSGPDVIRPEWIRAMAPDAIVFACANPVPEVWPWDAKAAGARIVATGRSDVANQVNNSLGFPGIFRGVLDVRARTITDEMAIAAAEALAGLAEQQGLCEERILPGMAEIEVAARVAAATGAKAQAQDVARKQVGPDRLYQDALAVIRAAREATRLLIEARCTMRANTTEDSVRAAAAAFARYIGGLCAEPATRDGLLKTAVREISLQLFDEFGDHYRLAEQLQTMAELAWLGPAALRAAEIAGTRGPSEHALGDVPIACISSAGFTPPP